MKAVVRFYCQYPALKWNLRWQLKKNWHTVASKLEGLWWDFPKFNGPDKRKLKTVLAEMKKVAEMAAKKFEMKVAVAMGEDGATVVASRDTIEVATLEILGKWRTDRKIRQAAVVLHKVNEEKDNPDDVTIILQFQTESDKDKAWDIKTKLADELMAKKLISKITSAGFME